MIVDILFGVGLVVAFFAACALFGFIADNV
ncbi:hypothetical protein LCGC14_3134920 [marine sediment metagenome]|uniref:Uncharacterized protein n=1 Tax=marine sediment metagenome TaxID=412755 RepID=A0A0F8WMI6_9ZZZZ